MASRLITRYEDLSAKFLVKAFDYQKQFAHLYAHRLAEMAQLLKPLALKKWGTERAIRKLCELREEQSEKCIIIGTIYKQQAHKPSILREISEENQLAPQPQRQNYADPDDKIILEDELQRVRLHGNVNAQQIATGVVCAVLGTIEEDGRFEVEEFLYYEGGPQKPLTIRNSLLGTPLVVLLSGLDYVKSHEYLDAINIFQHWLGGNIDFDGISHTLVRLIIAGNSVRSTVEQHAAALQTRNINEPNETVDAVRALDKWLAGWSCTIPIDIMPGPLDPANFMMPQQPFHNCMFPTALQNASFRSVPNPYACRLDDTLVVGCSGQNITDLQRSTQLEQPLEALRSTLIWSHMAPTAPDTLSCYPYVGSDPFILSECPHLYFAGNCPKFETDLHIGTDGKQTRLVCVPSFSQTQSVVIVNLETLNCRQVSFKS